MKKKKSEIKAKSLTELEKAETQIRQDIAKLKLESKVTEQKDTNLIRKKRKELALILTIKNQKKLVQTLKLNT